MHFAIIAAGEGSRLCAEGVTQPKPLVPIEGLPMIDRLMQIMVRCHAESVSVICNSAMTAVCDHLQQLTLGIPLHVITSQTPSSMHSLALLSEAIPAGKVIVTTVDTIFREADFLRYVQAFEQTDGALFAVTPFVDDEKPLWVSVDETSAPAEAEPAYPRVTAFCDVRPADGHPLVSGGIYGLETYKAWPVLHRCIAEGQSRMRNYQRALLAAGIKVRACVFDRIMDIDHASDILKAEQWLTGVRRVLLVQRAAEHSPNNVAKDAAILAAVGRHLAAYGYEVESSDEDHLSQLDLARYHFVMHMARRLSSLTCLSRLTVPVLNAPRTVMSLAHSREFVLSVLQEAGVTVPAWWAYEPEEDEMFQCEPQLQALLPGWVKATRAAGALADDVSYVTTPLEADACVIRLAAEQVPDIVVTRHEEGDLLKVYCVVPVDGRVPFVRTFYPQEQGYSKFGTAELHNSPLAHTPYDDAALQTTVLSIARALNVQVFGFDAVVRPDGTLVVIDVNDWPSFSLCREEAAGAIAQLIMDN